MASNVENAIRVIWGLLVRLVAVTAAAYVLYRVRTILISLLIAVLLTYALLPFVEWLSCRGKLCRKLKSRRLIATICVFTIFLLFVSVTVGIIITPFSRELSRFSENLQEYGEQMRVMLSKAGTWYTKAVPEDVKGLIGNLDYSSFTRSITGYFQGLMNATKSSIGIIMEVILIPVLAFYFVLDYRTLTREFYGLVPRRRRREAMRIGHDAGLILQNYVVGQIILCVIAGVLTAIVLSLLQVPYVVVLSLFAAITRAIPVIGPVVSGVPIVLVGLLNFPGCGMAVALIVFVVVMHFAESKFIMPYLIGERLHLHPAMVIIVLLIGAEFFGLIGMFLAAPVAAIIRELVRLYYIRPRSLACKDKRVRHEHLAQL